MFGERSRLLHFSVGPLAWSKVVRYSTVCAVALAFPERPAELAICRLAPGQVPGGNSY